MGYIVNSSACFLRLGLSKTLSVIVSDISNPHFSIIIKEIEEAARKEGYTSFVINTDENEELEHEAIVTSISKNVDGIIICPVQKSEKNVNFLLKSGVPFTLFGRRFESIDTNYVVCDDFNSGKMAAEYILHKNKSIAVVMAEKCISSSRERLDGIKEVFRSKKQELRTENIYFAHVSGDNSEILKKVCGKNYDGVICFSDLLAPELLSHDDKINIVSFDNITSKFPMPYKFKSITSSKTKMGQEAVKILLAAIKGEAENKHIVLPTKLS